MPKEEQQLVVKKPTIAQFYRLGFNLRPNGTLVELVLGSDKLVVATLPGSTTLDEVLQVVQAFLEQMTILNSDGWKSNWVPVLKKEGLI